MRTQLCAICEKNDFEILYKENINSSLIDEKIFSARRLPDRIHYQIVRCKKCGLVYSNPIFDIKKIEKLYKKSFISYDESIENLKKTYGFYLKELEKYDVSKNRLLDIGCGDGFFLEEALEQGYRSVFGVEPGKKSVMKAKPEIKKNIVVDFFRPGIFKKNFFDVILCFQTLDHVADPNIVLKECFSILKKDGLMLFLNHDVGAWTNKLLGEKSPIIDVEHIFLFDQKTMIKIFQKHGFKVLKIGSAFNIHHLGYWVHLFPLPKFLKLFSLQFLKWIKLYNLPLRVYPGNLVIIARK